MKTRDVCNSSGDREWRRCVLWASPFFLVFRRLMSGRGFVFCFVFGCVCVCLTFGPAVVCLVGLRLGFFLERMSGRRYNLPEHECVLFAPRIQKYRNISVRRARVFTQRQDVAVCFGLRALLCCSFLACLGAVFCRSFAFNILFFFTTRLLNLFRVFSRVRYLSSFLFMVLDNPFRVVSPVFSFWLFALPWLT